VNDRRAEALLLDDVYREIQDAAPDEQDVILLGDFNLPPEDGGMAEVDSVLDPVFTGGVRTTISGASLYDNMWWDHRFVGEWAEVLGVDHFDEAVFGNNDTAASLAVSDHRPIWITLSTYLPDDDGGHTQRSLATQTWGETKVGTVNCLWDRSDTLVVGQLDTIER
jgi:deoxyribonuclease-1-like protein